MNTKTIDPNTGEITQKQPTEIVSADLASRYALLLDEEKALDLDRQARLRELEAGEDGELEFIAQRLAKVAAERKAIAARWDEAFEHATPGTKIDNGGRVLITKPRPRTTWSLGKSAKEIGERQSLGELESLCTSILSDHAQTRSYDADITGAHLARAIIAWLDPTPKTGAQPPLRITVRPPAVNA